jgi:hypothetical protein
MIFWKIFYGMLWGALWSLANATLLGRYDKMFVIALYG